MNSDLCLQHQGVYGLIEPRNTVGNGCVYTIMGCMVSSNHVIKFPLVANPAPGNGCSGGGGGGMRKRTQSKLPSKLPFVNAFIFLQPDQRLAISHAHPTRSLHRPLLSSRAERRGQLLSFPGLRLLCLFSHVPRKTGSIGPWRRIQIESVRSQGQLPCGQGDTGGCLESIIIVRDGGMSVNIVYVPRSST